MRPKKKIRPTMLVALLLISLLLFPSRYQRWLQPVERLGTLILRPFLQLGDLLSYRALRSLEFFFTGEQDGYDYRLLQAENWTLKNELFRLRNMIVSEKEQSALEETEADVVIARIQGTETVAGERFWLIGRGSNDGLQNSAPVVADQDSQLVLLGRIIQLEEDSAVVESILSSSSSVSARLSESGFVGLADGAGWSLSMHYVNRLALGQIEPGELVVTSGFADSLFPENLLIGRVVRIDDSGYDASISLQLAPLLDISQLRYVLVLKGKNE